MPAPAQRRLIFAHIDEPGYTPDLACYRKHGGYEVMRKHREAQLATGHPFPQINEEYGYEDHYPVKWGGGKRPPTRNADNRRRMAWEIAMAGCHFDVAEW